MWDYDKVINHFTHYFKNLPRTPTSISNPIDDDIIAMGPCLSSSQQLTLLQPFTRKEIKEAILCIPNHKRLGPDGYTSEFFKSTRNIIVRTYAKQL